MLLNYKFKLFVWEMLLYMNTINIIYQR